MVHVLPVHENMEVIAQDPFGKEELPKAWFELDKPA